MLKYNSTEKSDSAKKWILWGIPILGIMGSVLHFLYELSGNSPLVGSLVPVNESVWEHLKMTYLPIIIWWFLGYFLLSKKNNISAVQWFFSCAISALAAPLFIVAFFYTYTGALGTESLVLDILSLFIAFAVSQLLALHVFKYARLKDCYIYLAFIILILIGAAYIIFTFAPPHMPLFMDSSTRKYGI